MNLFKPKNKEEKKTVINLPEDYLVLQQSLQELIPIEDVRDSMIVLPNHKYRAVVEVKSINYYLKTEEEQNSIEAMFKNALASWDFSFAFYTQTRTIDSDDIVRRLKEDVEKVTTKELKAYGRAYIDAMKELTKGENKNLIKKNYIIISCNDAETISNNKTQDDFDSYAFDRLNLSIKKVEEALSPIGLSCHVLLNEELTELIFVALNKHNILKANEILSFTSDMVSGKTEFDTNDINLILDGTINQFQKALFENKELSNNDYERIQELINKIQELKNQSSEEENNLFVL